MHLKHLSFGAKKAIRDLIVLYKQSKGGVPVDVGKLVKLSEEAISRNFDYLVEPEKSIRLSEWDGRNFNFCIRFDDLSTVMGTLWPTKNGFTIVVESSLSPCERRITICHELVHIFIYYFQGKLFSEKADIQEEDLIEDIICEEVAALLLCPLMAIKVAT